VLRSRPVPNVRRRFVQCLIVNSKCILCVSCVSCLYVLMISRLLS